MYMKTYSVLFILLFISTINLSAQVQDRFKTKKQTEAENKQEDAPEQDEEDDKANTKKSNQQMPKPNSEENIWDKVVIGGNASLSFGSYTFIYVAPTLGYKFTNNLIAGPGFIYQYAKISAYDFNGRKVGDYTNTVYGPKAFVNYIVGEKFYGGLQYEHLNHKVPVVTSPSTYELQYTWTPVLFIEAGYISPIGRKGFAQIGLRYNVLHGPDSPYGSPLFPFIGFFF